MMSNTEMNLFYTLVQQSGVPAIERESVCVWSRESGVRSIGATGQFPRELRLLESCVGSHL